MSKRANLAAALQTATRGGEPAAVQPAVNAHCYCYAHRIARAQSRR